MKQLWTALIIILVTSLPLSGNNLTYIPHIDITNSWDTTIMLDNLNNYDVSFTITYYLDGTETSNIGGTLKAGESKPISAETGTCGIISCSDSNIVSRVLYYHTEKGGVAEFKTPEAISTELNLLIPEYISDDLSWYGVALFNPGDSTTDVVLTALNPQGDILEVTNLSIAPLSRIADTVESVFEETDFRDIAYIRAASTSPICGLSLSGKDFDQFVFSRADCSYPSGKLFISHIAQEWDVWNNLLILTNAGEDTVEASLNFFSCGEKSIETDIIIPSLETVEIDLNDYRSLNPEWGTIEHSSENLAVRQVFINASSGNAAEFLLSSELSYNTMSYTLTPDITGLKNWTGISCLNTDSSPVSAVFRAWKDGDIQNTAEIDIVGYCRTAFTLSSLFPALEPERITVDGENLTGILITSRNESKLLFSPVSFTHYSNEEGDYKDLLTPEYYTTLPNSPFCNDLNRYVETCRKETLQHPFQTKNGSIPVLTVPDIGVFCSVKGPDAAATYHPAVDLHPENRLSQTPIFACHDGLLTLHRDDPKYRHHISITKDIFSESGELIGKMVTIYAHLDLDLDEEEFGHLDGTVVTGGDQISGHLYAGTVGGPHLHFEIRYYRAVDSGNETFYGLYSPTDSPSLTSPSTGPWKHGYWSTDTGQGYADPRNHSLHFYE